MHIDIGNCIKLLERQFTIFKTEKMHVQKKWSLSFGGFSLKKYCFESGNNMIFSNKSLLTSELSIKTHYHFLPCLTTRSVSF